MRVSRRKYCRVVSGLLHSTKDRRSSLSFCRLSFNKVSAGQTKLSSLSVGSMCMTVSCSHGKVKNIIHEAANSPWHMYQLEALVQLRADISQSVPVSQSTNYTTWSYTLPIGGAVKLHKTPTCRLAILFVSSSGALLRLFTAGSIGCHVHQGSASPAVWRNTNKIHTRVRTGLRLSAVSPSHWWSRNLTHRPECVKKIEAEARSSDMILINVCWKIVCFRACSESTRRRGFLYSNDLEVTGERGRVNCSDEEVHNILKKTLRQQHRNNPQFVMRYVAIFVYIILLHMLTRLATTPKARLTASAELNRCDKTQQQRTVLGV